MAAKFIQNTALMLSSYAEKLTGDVKSRYAKKISEINIDPLLIPVTKLSEECLPPVECMDLLSYLVLDTSFYTNAQFKAFRSLQAYNQMVSGFISSVLGCIINERYVVLAKVRHSQRMNDPLVQLWIITNEEGTVMSAHCTGCMAGLGECCSHIASVLFYLEVWTRQNGRLACTQVKCNWILPSFVKKVEYAKVKDIDFTSARKLKADMEKSLNDRKLIDYADDASKECTKARPLTQQPDKAELENFYSSLNECKIKPACLSLVEPYAEAFISKTRGIPTIRELFDEKHMQLTYTDLLKECHKVKISLTEEQMMIIEKETRTQAKGSAFYQQRAGRIGASKCHAASHTDPSQPSQSLIKTLCYPDVFNFSTAATRHGCKHEDLAIAEYEKQMKLKHENFKVVKCGTFINKDYPFLHATPDFLCSCDCCGLGLGEVKCPYCIDGLDFDSYVLKPSSCLVKTDSKFQLKRNHSYYSQVQQQLHTVPDRDYCDFVVCAVENEFVQLHTERITPDNSHWQEQLPKLSLFWRICILPEIMGRWYTRKLDMKPPGGLQVDGDCYCRVKTSEETVTCSNISCPVSKFHPSCLSIQKVPKTWYCPHCRKMPKFQPGKRVKIPKVEEKLSEAMTRDKICICEKKAESTDKLLKCHNENCSCGAYFHLSCMGYKRFPNNAKTTWVCPHCSVSIRKNAAKIENKEGLGSCSNLADPNFVLDDDVQEIKIIYNSSGTDKVSSLGALTEKEFSLINSRSGWLDCTIIHQAQILLKDIDPLIEGFQRPTLGPCNNFDVVGGEFIQILNTGANHWVCVSSIGCPKGCVNVYDSLFNNIINDDIEEQTKNLVCAEFDRLIIVPVQQQQNGSDCGVFSIAYATSLVYKEAPETVTYDIAKMRPHLLKCLQTGVIEQFPTCAI